MKGLWIFLKNLICPRKDTLAMKIGKMGEDAAVKFLKTKGIKIVHRNWRNGRDEIDIICKDVNTLVFVEVKTRKNSALVSGYFAGVQKDKKTAIRRASKAYMKTLRSYPKTWRFDVIAVEYGSDNRLNINHYQNVY